MEVHAQTMEVNARIMEVNAQAMEVQKMNIYWYSANIPNNLNFIKNNY